MNNIVLLKHISINNDEKILGCFEKENIDNIIKDYIKLEGFSLNIEGFDYSKTVETFKDYVYLLQIWVKGNDEHVLFDNIYAHKHKAEKVLNDYLSLNNIKKLDYQIEKYTINQRHWIDGYRTCTYQ